MSAMTTTEGQLEETLIEKLISLKNKPRKDIRDRATLEKNFREKFEALNRVRLTEAEFPRLLEEIITPGEREEIAAYIDTLKAGEGLSASEQ